MNTPRSIHDIHAELNELQLKYIEEEDERLQGKLVSRFSACLAEATTVDGVDRIAAGVTIHNWVLED